MAFPVSSYETLAEMIAPALFMTATGSLIVSTANRIGRIVDRIRVLVDLGDNLSRGVLDVDYPEIRLEQTTQHLQQLERRSNMALRAVRFLYLAFGLFVSSSLAVAVDLLFQHNLFLLPIIFSVCGVSSMLGACVNLVYEAMLALKNNNMSLRFFRELQALRKQDKEAALKNQITAKADPASH